LHDPGSAVRRQADLLAAGPGPQRWLATAVPKVPARRDHRLLCPQRAAQSGRSVFNASSCGLRSLVAVPSRTDPSAANRDPCSGQSQVHREDLQRTTDRSGEIAEGFLPSEIVV
jgi:hypothetical protein